MFDFVRVISDDSAIIGRVFGGRKIGLSCVHIAPSVPYEKEWCRNHGMKLIQLVIKEDRTAWYELWMTEDRHLACLFLI